MLADIKTMKFLRKPLSLKSFILIPLFFLVNLKGCYYDPNPPALEELLDKEIYIYIKIRGLAPYAKLAFRYWDSEGVQTSGLSNEKKCDDQGNFEGALPLDQNSTQSYVQIFVDQNKNESWDKNDLAYSKSLSTLPDLTSDPDQIRLLKIELSESDFLNLYQVSINPAQSFTQDGIYFCIFSPESQANWNSTAKGNFASSSDGDISIPLSDWTPLYSFTVSAGFFSATRLETFLPQLPDSENYSGSCFSDANGNNAHDSDEESFTILPFLLNADDNNSFALE